MAFPIPTEEIVRACERANRQGIRVVQETFGTINSLDKTVESIVECCPLTAYALEHRSIEDVFQIIGDGDPAALEVLKVDQPQLLSFIGGFDFPGETPPTTVGPSVSPRPLDREAWEAGREVARRLGLLAPETEGPGRAE